MLKRIQIATVLAAGALICYAPAGFAQDTNSKHHANRTTADHNFVIKAAQGGLAEVELGKLAQEKAASSDVKQFAQTMVNDHSKANDELKEVASKDNVTLPTTLSGKDAALKNRLEKLSGPAFDKAYMTAMVKDHREDVSEFRRESEHGQNADVKSFASKTLPTLEQHLKMAEETHAKVAK